ncbi:hypothetical protein ACR3K2_28350 [Cryptosporidium serpentis]
MENNKNQDIVDTLEEFLSNPLCMASYERLTSNISVIEMIQTLSSTQKPEEIALLTDSLKRCISLGVIQDALEGYSDIPELLVTGSKSSNQNVRSLIAYVFSSLTESDASCLKICEDGSYISLAILLRDTEMSIGESACQSLKYIAKYYPKYIYDEGFLSILMNKFKELNDETRLRIIGLFIDIVSSSEQLFNICEEKGHFFTLALQEYFTDDILLKLASLRLLEDLGEYKYGLKFLYKESISILLLKDLDNPLVDDEVRIAILYLLSKMTQYYPEGAENILKSCNKVFLLTLKSFMASSNNIHALGKPVCAITCWGLISCHETSFKILSNLWSESIQLAIKYISSSNTELSLAAINAWIIIFETGDIKNILKSTDEEICLEKQIETKLIPSIMTIMLSRPFPEIRTLIYRILAAMIPFFGSIASIICTSQPHKDLILNSNSDSDKEVKYLKYNLVKLIVKYHLNLLEDKADELFIKYMQDYAKGGPFYINPSFQVDIADSVL